MNLSLCRCGGPSLRSVEGESCVLIVSAFYFIFFRIVLPKYTNRNTYSLCPSLRYSQKMGSYCCRFTGSPGCHNNSGQPHLQFDQMADVRLVL